MHDFVIENTTLIDGLGTPARRGSLAVEDGRIAAVGESVGTARERIDAQGLTLAPGIIDLHTHFDAQLLWDPFATPSTALGVTSVVVTHEMDSAFRIGTRMVLLDRGRFIVSGTPQEMRESTDPLVRQFVHGLTTGPLTERRLAGGYEVDLLGGDI